MGLILDRNGKLPGIAFPGGYTILYLHYEGGVFCRECAQEIYDDESYDAQFKAFVHWEGPPLFCEDCLKELPSEYGDPDEQQAT